MLTKLSDDIIQHIVDFLPSHDMPAVKRSCKAFRPMQNRAYLNRCKSLWHQKTALLAFMKMNRVPENLEREFRQLNYSLSRKDASSEEDDFLTLNISDYFFRVPNHLYGLTSEGHPYFVFMGHISLANNRIPGNQIRMAVLSNLNTVGYVFKIEGQFDLRVHHPLFLRFLHGHLETDSHLGKADRCLNCVLGQFLNVPKINSLVTQYLG